MPTIEYNVEQEQLELISGGTSTGEQFSEHLGHYIKLSVFDDSGNFIKSYYSNRDWNNELILFSDQDGTLNQPINDYDFSTTDAPTPQIIIYRTLDDSESPKFWIKPNDVLSNDPSIDYSTGRFRLKFDFLDNLFYNNAPSDKRDNRRFYINEISDSRREVRLLARVNQYQMETSLGFCDDETSFTEEDCTGTWTPNPNYGQTQLIDDNAVAPMSIDFRQWFDTNLKGGTSPIYEYNFFLTLPNSSHQMIVNWEWDFSSLETTSLIIKIKDPLPTTEDLQYKLVSIEREIFDTQIENILFIGDEIDYSEVTSLSPTMDNLNTSTTYNNTLQSYNQLIDSSSLSNEQQSRILESVFSSSLDNIDIDFSKFENHVHFGSAEYKFLNFFNKVKKIENEYTNISSSLNVLASAIRVFSTQSGDVLNRKKSYETINGIISNFTPYEKWMYFNYSTTASMPNMGMDYSAMPAISGTFDENNTYIDGGKSEILNDYYGLKSVYKVSTVGDDVIRSGSFSTSSAEQTPMSASWYTGSEYTAVDEGWFISGSALHANQTASAGDTLPYVYQVSTQSFANDGTISDPPVNTNIQQFESAQSYVIEFDVPSFEEAGNIIFRFHGTGHGYNGGIYQTSVRVTGTGAQKGISSDISVGESMEDVGNTYNYLTILSDGGFSGSIDNLVIRAQKDNDGRGDIFTDKYRIEQPPFANSTSSFYLSFLGQFSDQPNLENYNATQSVDIGNNRNIPLNAWGGGYYSTSETFSPAVQSGSFRHYIIEASQSHWRFSGAHGTEIGDGLSSTALAADSTKFEILSESRITGSESFQMTDSNGLFDGTGDPSYWNLLAYQNQSILPSGELFRYYHTTSSDARAPVTSSIITDVKIMRKDNLWGGTPDDILLFSHTYSTSSSTVESWYDTQLSNAKSYDLENIYSLRNNLPKHLFRNESDSIVLKKFLATVGEVYDFLKLYIDNYERINNRDYNKFSGTPDGLIDIVGEHFGWEFLNINNVKPLLDYYIGIDRSFSYKDLTYSIWRNIINNLVNIYKTKGTETSIRSLMNCFGIPSNAITINQYGSSTIKSVETSPGEFDLSVPEAIDEREGNVSYNILDRELTFLNFRTEGDLGFITNWNIVTGSSKVNTGLNTGVSFVINPTQTGSNQTLALSSGSHSQSMWRLEMSSSEVHPQYSASIHFQINTSPSSSNWNTILSSSTLPLKEDPNQITQVMLSRTNMSSDTGSYRLDVTSRKSQLLYNQYYSSVSTDITSSVMNTNFTSSAWNAGGYPSQREGGNLLFGSNYYGGMTEIRVYGTSSVDLNQDTNFFNEGHFLMKGLNYENTTGNTLESFKKIVSRYNMKGNWVGASSLSSIPDMTENNSFENQALLPSGTNLQNFSSPTFRKVKYKAVQFGVRNLSTIEQINKNKIRLTKSADKKFLRQSLQPGTNNLTPDSRPEHKKNKDLELERVTSYKASIGVSADRRISEILVDNMSDQDIGQKIGDPRKQKEYRFEDLDKFRDDILSNYNIGTNQTNKFNNRIAKRIPNAFYEIVERLIPSRIQFSSGPSISNDLAFKSKEVIEKGNSTYDINAFNKFYNTTFDLVEALPLYNSSVLSQIKNEDTNFVLKDIQESIETKSFLKKNNNGKLDWYGDEMFSNSKLQSNMKANLDKVKSFEEIGTTLLNNNKVNIYDYSKDLNINTNIFEKLKSNSIRKIETHQFITSFTDIRKTNDININYFDNSNHTIYKTNKSNAIQPTDMVDLSSNKSNLFQSNKIVGVDDILGGENYTFSTSYRNKLKTSLDNLSNQIDFSTNYRSNLKNTPLSTDEELEISSLLSNRFDSNIVEDVVDRNLTVDLSKRFKSNTLTQMSDDNLITLFRTQLISNHIDEITNKNFVTKMSNRISSNVIDDVTNRQFSIDFQNKLISNNLESTQIDLSTIKSPNLKSNAISEHTNRDVKADNSDKLKSNHINKSESTQLTTINLDKFDVNTIDKLNDVDISAKNPFYNNFTPSDNINKSEVIELNSKKANTNIPINHIVSNEQIEISSTPSTTHKSIMKSNSVQYPTIQDDSFSVKWKESYIPTKVYLGDAMWEELNIIKFNESLNINPGGYTTKEYDDWKFFDTSVTSTGSFDEDYSGSFGAFVDTMGGFLDYTTSKYISAGFSTRTFSRSIGDTEQWIPVEFTKTPYYYQLGPHQVKSIVQGTELSYHKPNEFNPTDMRQFTNLAKDNKGRKIGRTIQFTEDENGNITYPNNHYKNVCGGIENLTLHKILFEGTQFTDGDGQTTFDPTNQIDPTKPVTRKITSSGKNNRLIVE
jgi:hypothetical protein